MDYCLLEKHSAQKLDLYLENSKRYKKAGNY